MCICIYIYILIYIYIVTDRHLEHQKFSKNANPTLRTCLQTTAGDQDAVLSLDLEHQIKKQENSQKTVT